MSIESEVKAAVQAVTGEGKTIETAIEGTVAAAEGEVKTVAAAVETEAKKVEGEVKAEVKAAEVAISAEEKLFLREAELEFLKAQMEIQRLQKIADTQSKTYAEYIEKLFVKYALSKVEYVFNGTVNSFKKL